MKFLPNADRRPILPVDQIPAAFTPLGVNGDRKLYFLPGQTKLDALRDDPDFADEPVHRINCNGATMDDFVDSHFLALWVWLYPDLKIPKGEEREKLRDYVRVAAYLRSVQEGFELYPSTQVPA